MINAWILSRRGAPSKALVQVLLGAGARRRRAAAATAAGAPAPTAGHTGGQAGRRLPWGPALAATAALPLMVAGQPVHAASPVSVAEALRECAAITGDAPRLACFDALAAGTARPPAAAADAPAQAARPTRRAEADGASGTPRRSTATAADGSATATDDGAATEDDRSTRRAMTSAQAEEAPAFDEDAFGREEVERRQGRRDDRDDQAQRLEAVVSAVYKRRDDRYEITLENGQVWMEKTSGNFFRVREGDDVTIKRGWFGSYRMLANGRATDVERVK